MSEHVEQTVIDRFKVRIDRLVRDRDQMQAFAIALIGLGAACTGLGIDFGMKEMIAETSLSGSLAVFLGGTAVCSMISAGDISREASDLRAIIDQHELQAEQLQTEQSSPPSAV